MSYTEIKGSFLSANKSNNISYRICIPESNPKAVIQISHGMCEYFDRYENTVKYFTEKGFVVCGNDHMGHGNSVSGEEELGYFGIDTYECFADDLKQLNDIVRKKYRSLPYILIGHSMGSFVARDYITRYSDSIDGVVICGTSGTNKAVGAGILVCSLLEKIKGDKYRSRFVKKLSFKGYNDRFADEKDDLSWLTREISVRNAYSHDPKCSFVFTVSGYKNMFNLLKKVSAEGWENKVPQSLPVLIISGAEDPVGNYGKGVAEVCERLDNRELNNLKCKIYPEARHELFNESNRTEVLGDVKEFVDEVIEGVLEARGYVR